MSIKLKVALIFFGVILFVELAEIGMQVLVVLPSFEKMERAEADKDLRRARHAIDGNLQHLDSLCHDWSAWDDTYEFVADRSTEYVEANLPQSSFVDNNLQAIVFLDIDGNVVWGRVLDPETTAPTNVKELPEKTFGSGHFLMDFGPKGGKLADLNVKGIMNTEKGPMLISSRPILTSQNEGPVKGAVIMGRFFTEKLRQEFVVQTQVRFRAYSMEDGNVPGHLKAVAEKAGKETVFLTPPKYRDPLKAVAVYAGLGGSPGLLLEATIPRDIWTRGVMTVRYMLVSNLIVGILVFVAMSLLLTWTVLNPLRKLMFHTHKVRKTRDLSLRLNLDRRDEIGVLAKEFDDMLSELSSARSKLLEQHYFSGMAAMASGVIHNIRNQLNPMMGQLQIVREHLAFGGRDADVLVPKLDTILGQFYQMENILVEHEKWAREKKSVEPVDVNEVLREAFDLLDDNLKKVVEIKTRPGFENAGNFTANRMTLLQIFVVLLTNSAESLLRAGKGNGTVAVDASTENKDGRRIFRIELRDDGQGMAERQIARVFERNFSVKPEGASGIGLHWCANAMASMNGAVTMDSAGEGKGACVRLKWFQSFACIETEKKELED